MLFCAFVGTAWAQTAVNSVTDGKWYKLECTSSAAHSTTRHLLDNGTSLNGQSAQGSFFKFVPASEGKYYIQSYTSGKTVNAKGTSVELGEEGTTEWTIGKIGAEDAYVYISSSDKNYLNNAGGTGNIQIKTHDPITSNNACSLWALHEYDSPEYNYGELANDASATTTWNFASWVNPNTSTVPVEIPADATTVESTQYPAKQTNIKLFVTKVTANKGTLLTTLNYAGGNNRLDILGVELVDVNDSWTVLSDDFHFGYSGTAKVNNKYKVEVPSNGTYYLRYWVTFCAEANTSNGNITLQHLTALPIYSASELANNKVYTVTPSNKGNDNTGAWDVNGEKTMLSLTKYTDGIDATDVDQQFAFLNVNDEFYLYSYGAGKFVANDENGQKLTDELGTACLVTFDASTIANKAVYPLCVRVGGDHLCATPASWYAGNGGIVTNWNDTGDAGNAVAIVEVDGTVDLSVAIAKIEAYQISVLKASLNERITEAQTFADKSYINSSALEAAILSAQGVVANETATYGELKAEMSALTSAITAAVYVTSVSDFSNNAIYTFLSKRNATAYLMYDGTNGFLASPYKQTGLEVGEDKVNCQWAVYKSVKGNYYMYNLGAQKFMGIETAANTGIPFSATPQTNNLGFKNSSVATHPIMITPNGGSGVVNHSSEASFTNNFGVVNWSGGYGFTEDSGNVHKVTIVGELDAETLANIEVLVTAFESNFEAKQALGEYLDWFYSNYYDSWGSGWRNQPGVNNYSQPAEDQPINEAYAEIREFYNSITTETSSDLINAKKTYLEGLEANVTINQPEAGKFYRLRCVDGQKRLQSTTNSENSRLTMANDTGKESVFLLHEGALLSYAKGLYADHHVFNTVGVKSTVEFSEAVNGTVGCYNILVGPNYIYGAGSDIDSGNGTPDDRGGYNWWLEEVTSLPVTVTAAGYASFYAPVAVELPAEGLEAYYVSKAENGWATLTLIEDVIPANTGVLLKGAEGSYDLTIVESATALEGTNLLEGTIASSYISADAYALGFKDGQVGFYIATKNFDDENQKVEEGGVKWLNNGFKAYLPKPANAQGALRFNFGGETTAIESVVTGLDTNAAIYDLSGRRVEKAVKGIYIQNGKKFIVK